MMDITQIEANLETLLSGYTEDNFIYGLLSAYGHPNAAIARLKKGDYNVSKIDGAILWKKKVFFKKEINSDLHSVIDQLSKTPAISKQHPRFIIVTDFKTFLALDTDNSDTLDIPIKDLARHFDFFLPWAGMEKAQLQSENPADIKAAERMGRLYDLILEENPIVDEEQRHALNVFFTRLLFCFFAEDTGIFPKGIFVNGIASHTTDDGGDLQGYLTKLFSVLNTQDRKSCPKFLSEYPYVNGGLFANESPVPRFNSKSRKLLIETGALNWKAINPDIFGSMMQAVVHTDERSGKGMHYTSVVNIMKVIEPLFLNDLKAELESAGESKQRLNNLLERIYKIKIFDPACGSGNFLIIAYKELCKLEIEVFKRLHHGQMSFRFQSQLKLNQFYGIEIDDFAHETARLSLWLTQHQMNLAFREVFGEARPTLPLRDAGNIFCGNATNMEWAEICPKELLSEVYILGNPPYVGSSMQSKEQKHDLASICINAGFDSYKNMDYISCWFIKAAQYLCEANAECAFVATNSICQGDHVALLWPRLLEKKIEIGFACRSFKWTNNARGNAGVACVIVGLRCTSQRSKHILSDGISKVARNINAYLIDGPDIYFPRRTAPISELPNMIYGSKPTDDGQFILTRDQRDSLLATYPRAAQFIKEYIGSDEFINGQQRWCLWITDESREDALTIPPIEKRLNRIAAFRRASKAESTVEYAEYSHRFKQRTYQDSPSIIVPSVTSERRECMPIGFLTGGSVVNNLAYVVYHAEPFLFSILSSKMHYAWVKCVAGRLETRIRYSSSACYNNFPLPPLTDQQRKNLERCAFAVLDIRERHSEKNIAQLYDPDLMPPELRNAHRMLDVEVDGCFRSRPFNGDEERVGFLFKLYLEMTSKLGNLEACNAKSC